MDLFQYAQSQQQEAKEETSSKDKDVIYSVFEITSEIKQLVQKKFGSNRIWIKGELSNYKGKNQSGHIYFLLKDDKAVINCAFFKNLNNRLQFELEEGMEVLVLGRIDVYEKAGRYQLIVEDIRPGGVGELYLKFEQLKKKLESEGLFDPKHKKTLPKYVSTIGIVTSATGAVIKDIIHVISSRYPVVKLILYPVKVQGDGAALEIANAIRAFNGFQNKPDVLIVGRGGGSIEDLWAFNEEVLARAVFQSTIPVVSAVGHQTDFTICDFVSDVRAATPSQAAELVVPNLTELLKKIDLYTQNISHNLNSLIESYAQKLKHLKTRPVLTDPNMFFVNRAMLLDDCVDRMRNSLKDKTRQFQMRFDKVYLKKQFLLGSFLKSKKMNFEKVVSNLALLNPLSILSRGYAVVQDQSKKIIKNAQDVKLNQHVRVRLSQGELECQVHKILKTS